MFYLNIYKIVLTKFIKPKLGITYSSKTNKIDKYFRLV